MLWNWYTVDSCFITRSWHVTSRGMFAGSCVGVVLLTMSLELLRRAVKEYDRYLVRSHSQHSRVLLAREESSKMASGSPAPVAEEAAGGFRPNVFQQAVRALLHMVQFAVAYFIMLYVFCLLLLWVGWEIWEKRGRASLTEEPGLRCTTTGTSSSVSSSAPSWAVSSFTGRPSEQGWYIRSEVLARSPSIRLTKAWSSVRISERALREKRQCVVVEKGSTCTVVCVVLGYKFASEERREGHKRLKMRC